MHTTEQAKTLWCPMARVARHEVVTVHGTPIGNLTPVSEAHHIVGGTNRDALASPAGFVLNSCRCVADQCAMWRWGSAPAQPRWKYAENQRALFAEVAGPRPTGCANWEFQAFDRDEGNSAIWIEPQAQADAGRLGHCGLAPLAHIAAA